MNDRRTFLSRLAALGATLGVVPAASAIAASAPTSAIDDPWVARLTGTHKVIFHSHLPTDGLAIGWARTFLDTQKGSYGLADTDSSVVVGLNGRSIGWFFGDALWAKYPTIGEIMGTPGAKNPQAALIASLVPRGVILLACNNSIRASGSRFLPEARRGDATARNTFAEEVKATLLPGVEVVPAMVVTLQQAQARGCQYIYAGS